MKAAQFSEYGEPEVLSIQEVDEPHAGPGQIRIAVRAAGVNGIDWKIRSGMFRDAMPVTLPSGTGVDAAGVVDEVGEDVSDVAVGDEVFGNGRSTVAEHAVLTSWAKKPSTVSFVEAAGYPIPAETALRILNEVGIEPGQALLVSGASGGVGSAVLQLARVRGINVVATAGARNQDYLRSLGAVPTIYGPGLVTRVREIAPDGIDAAVDIAGSGVIAELIELTGDPSHVLSIADFGATLLGAKVSSKVSDMPAALAQVARLNETGEFSLEVGKTFSLDKIADAQALSNEGHTTGRIVVVVE